MTMTALDKLYYLQYQILILFYLAQDVLYFSEKIQYMIKYYLWL